MKYVSITGIGIQAMRQPQQLGNITITLSGSDRVLVKEATQELKRLLGNNFALTDGPIEECGTVEVGCEYRFPRAPRMPHLRLVKAARAFVGPQKS